MKYKHYVALIYSRKVSYVTSVDNSTKVARWELNKPAKVFPSKSSAENLVFGLTANGYPAVIITMPDFYEPFNLEEDEREVDDE